VSDTANSAEVAPLTVSTIPEVIKRAQALFADDEAFVEPDQRLTYGQLIDQIHIGNRTGRPCINLGPQHL
jgi:hypothetical protein